MPSLWMDAHCHLSDQNFDAVRESLYQELVEARIHGLVLAGTNPADWIRQENLQPPAAIRLARVFGIHPWNIDEMSDQELEVAVETLEKSLPRCQGLGELGLDYFRAKTPATRSRHRIWFERQLDIHAPDHPLVLHVVKGHHECLPILSRRRPHYRGLVHSFWANLEVARAYIRLGFLLSVPPRIMKGDPHQLLHKIDPEHIVFETDTPYYDAKSELIKPVLIRDILQFVSAQRQESLDTTRARQTRLLCTVFPILNGD